MGTFFDESWDPFAAIVDEKSTSQNGIQNLTFWRNVSTKGWTRRHFRAECRAWHLASWTALQTVPTNKSTTETTYTCIPRPPNQGFFWQFVGIRCYYPWITVFWQLRFYPPMSLAGTSAGSDGSAGSDEAPPSSVCDEGEVRSNKRRMMT